MHIQSTQENLAKALSLVGRMVGTRGTLPVLGNILVSVQKGRLRLAATDLEVGVQTWIGGKVEEEGSLTVPARLFVDFVATNTDPMIELRSKDTTLHLESEHFSANIKGIDASEFPLIPEIKRINPIRLPAKELKEAITQTVFATAIDETRPVLTGVLLKIEGESLRFVATDSYRLAEKIIPLKDTHSPLQVIIPARTLQEVQRLISPDMNDVELYISENQILFVLGETEFISRLIDGSFPDYTQIIPKQTITQMELDKNAFAQVMKMASFFARESANNVQFKLTGQGMEVTAVSPQLGDTVSRLSGTMTGEDLEIAFNAKFVLDALSIFPGNMVSLHLSGKLQAGVLRSPDHPHYLYLIMPLRVDS